MLKRLLTMFLALTLLIPFATPFKSVTANPEAPEERLVQIITGSWDLWKHEDGRWQASGKPGDRDKTINVELGIPEKFKEGYKNIRVEIKQGPPTKADNDDPNLEPQYKQDWIAYEKDILGKSAVITNYSISGYEVTLSFALPTPPQEMAVNIRKEEEAKGQQFLENVEGWRYYLPFVVYWYGTKEVKPEPPEKQIKLFRRLGDNRLAIHKPERLDEFGVGGWANWQLVYHAIPGTITSTVDNHRNVARFDSPKDFKYYRPMVLWSFEWRTTDGGKTITVTNTSKVPDTLYLELHKDEYQEGNPIEAFSLEQGESIKLPYPTNQGYFLYAATPPERFGFWDNVTDRDGWGDKYTTEIPSSLQEAVNELLERHRQNISN